ncbi:helix-turn-helix transcriptional regulator [Candidatus Parcubacteria bacterium]|nr:helix-turn-helix transcriptional regulator [Candidatus Parcubacteria bacterium]
MPFIKKSTKLTSPDEYLICIKSLGQYLKKLRNEQAISIRQVAKKCDISPSYLSKIENGNVFKSISIKTLLSLSEFYRIPIYSILEVSGLIKDNNEVLPNLAQYLRIKYKLSPQAIHDIEIAKEIVDNKYVD